VKFPPIDHTLGTNEGNYIKVSRVNSLVTLFSTITRVTSLNNNNPSKARPMCIKFWYYLSGSQDSSNFLQIELQKSNFGTSSTAWTRTALMLSQTMSLQQWLYGRVTFNAALNDKVLIEGQITNPGS